jgi:hypothetical protein
MLAYVSLIYCKVGAVAGAVAGTRAVAGTGAVAGAGTGAETTRCGSATLVRTSLCKIKVPNVFFKYGAL